MREETKLLEQAHLLAVCKEANDGDLDKAAEDFFCIQDMLGILKIQSVAVNFGKTKTGRLRKGGMAYNLIENRLEELTKGTSCTSTK